MTTAAESLQQAFELHRAGRFDEAERGYRQVLAAEPHNAQAWQLLGIVAHQQGKHAQAVENFGRALACHPTSVETLNNLAVALRALCRWDEAAAACRRALEISPSCAEAYANLGLIRHDQKRTDESLACFRDAIRLKPDLTEAHAACGAVLRSQGDHQGALARFREAVRLSPRMAQAHCDLGGALKSLGKYAEAIACYEEALRLDANLAVAHSGLGAALHRNQQPAEALAANQRALALMPDRAEAYCNVGVLLGELRQFAEALARFDEAEKLQPDLPLIHHNRAMVLLLMGDFAAGWPQYEWRLRAPGAPEQPPGPAWDGKPLGGRTILLYPEQGRGDMLQFIRYAPLVKARGGRVIVGCPKEMIPILSTCRGIDAWYIENPPPPSDEHAALASLPGIFHTDLNSIPADVPYLSAPAEPVDKWRAALGDDGAFRVGINWQGSPSFPWDFQRSMPLAAFAPLAQIPGVRLFSLQKGAGVEQLADAPFAIDDLGSKLDEGGAAFLDTAAVIKNLDLVVTSDTAVAHLAGALGAPVWVALSYAPDWRWLLDREDSPWYPTMRLFRQAKLGDWTDVFRRIATELSDFAAQARSTSGGS